jgi:hypothetical protein
MLPVEILQMNKKYASLGGVFFSVLGFSLTISLAERGRSPQAHLEFI